MLFCPKCRSIMMPRAEGTKRVLACSCGYKAEAGTITISESKKKEEPRDIAAVEKDVDVRPRTEAECPKCRHTEAFAWERQTRAGDEPPTKFLQCTKCKHTWRDYK
jgi:DNA-directed RNA polymerase subunit M